MDYATKLENNSIPLQQISIFMRKIYLIAIFALLSSMVTAQDKCFWVFFTGCQGHRTLPTMRCRPLRHQQLSAERQLCQCGRLLLHRDFRRVALAQCHRRGSHRRQCRSDCTITICSQCTGNRFRRNNGLHPVIARRNDEAIQ